MSENIVSTGSRVHSQMPARSSRKRTTLLLVAAASLAGVVAVVAPLTGRTTEISSTVATETPEAKVTPLFSRDLKDLPGKEGLMIAVEYPPGCVDPVHRHNAHAFVYVLEGSIVMQVKGGKEQRLTPGQTFYEGPDDIHTVGRNASTTEPAKFVVFLVKDKSAPVLVPLK